MPEVASEQIAAQDGEAPWHSLTTGEVLARLQSSTSGLSQAEATRRLRVYGPNKLPEPPRFNPVRRFLAQFNSALVYFLLAAAAAAAVLSHHVDAGVILAVVIVNAIVGFAQEGKAERALAAIGELISPQATVLRDGYRQTVEAESLVPGDVIMLEAGDRVPADMRILRARALTIDESLLTGESVTAEKSDEPVAIEAPLGDRRGMAFSGTMVATGRASAVVTVTGARTRIGRISGMLSDIAPLTTPLLRQINRFGRRFTQAIFVGAALLFLFAVFARGFAASDALVAVVALAVGAMPEGLPAAITVTLAIGVQRMAARKAVIRKLPAVETLGATSVICTDKTGTLTRNEMTVRHIFIDGHDIVASGSGYAPEGTLTAESHDDDASAIAAATAILRCGLLCNDAHLKHVGAHWHVEGDPMDGALIAVAMKTGIDPDHERGEWTRLDEVPFDAAHRFMATLNKGPAGEIVAFIKGAPEALFAMLDEEAAAARWEPLIARAASAGERVLGFAAKRFDAPIDRLEMASLPGSVEMLGLMGFIDPPRDEAKAAIAECRSAGIAVKMITGDHRATALAIARQLQLADDPQAMTGAEIDAVSDEELRGLAERVSIFARTSPEHKLRIVRALQASGAIVAMTGDGVNDAPSLKQADVGTAMGIKGTEAARQAAQMVLLDDNFASIVAAVHEGRTVHDNIRKVIAWTLPTNGGETVAVVLAILLGFALPMTATQILWVNLVTEATLGLALAFERPEPGVMARPPRARDAPLLSRFLLWRVLLVSVLFGAVLLFIFFEMQSRGADLATTRTMVVNMLVIAETAYLFNVRYLHMRSLTLRGAVGTPAVLIAIGAVVIGQVAFTYLPFMNETFGTKPLSLAHGAVLIGIGIVMFFLLEAEKLIMPKLGWFDDLRS